MKKEELFNYGVKIINEFCELNNIKKPNIVLIDGNKRGACGYYTYRNKTIHICLKKCAREVTTPTGWGWSHHGYFSDREPAGVVCHEFGHYLHHILTNNKMKLTAKGRITSYEPNYYERFAETIKLFMLNPDLLKQYNPARYKEITSLGIVPVITTDWKTTLGKDINPKFIAAAENKIKKNNS